ncbi:dihydrofolate reductase family protein [Gordonia zhaorongruii]|uniref:dihydrofolate reductase family protein n=1 Tax=Gordonia zhaorongruii TaxID=2597659 RepID=UPI0014044ADA|nr:dihydrofolate reductase family protein [Gordonia zhaorongruii]
MRQVIVNNIVSLDGRYADESGNPLALNMDGAFDRANLESAESADLILLGRESFDGFSAHWPFVADAPEPDDVNAPEARAFDAVNRAMSRRYNSLPKVVVTDRGPIPAGNPWHDSTTTIGRADVAGWLAIERERGDGAIVIFGSHVLWNVLLAEGLVDELHLMVSPTVLGTGVSAFTGAADLRLLESRTVDDSGNVQLRYAVRS